MRRNPASCTLSGGAGGWRLRTVRGGVAGRWGMTALVAQRTVVAYRTLEPSDADTLHAIRRVVGGAKRCGEGV